MSEHAADGVPDVAAGPGVISVAVIEDNRLVREGITALLNQLPDLRVVGGGSTGDTALIGGVHPHVVLLDLGLRNGDSLRIAERVKKEFPESRVIVMDLLPVHEDIMEFVNAGVSGFIMKDATLDDLANTIRSVAKGTNVLPPQMTGTLFSQIARDAVAKGRPEVLESVRMTPREREVINLIAEGLANKEIAARLHIATHTVKSHVRNVMEKLTLHTRLQIAAYAHRDGQM
ncbi:MAG: LuxR C-terminal-related transcriptional regulator [Gemmatimonadales bacterium]|jgi:DNA-binding NarL/FixJ family response regulator